MRSLIVVALLCLFSAAYGYTDSGSLTIDAKSAYCYYYDSSSVSVSNMNTWINGTSNNLYGYISVYASPSDSLGLTSTTLAICSPNQGNHNECSTQSIQFTYSNSVETTYIFVCMECHYWFGPCIFDEYNVALTNSAPQEGYVDCSFCH